DLGHDRHAPNDVIAFLALLDDLARREAEPALVHLDVPVTVEVQLPQALGCAVDLVVHVLADHEPMGTTFQGPSMPSGSTKLRSGSLSSSTSSMKSPSCQSPISVRPKSMIEAQWLSLMLRKYGRKY